MCGIAGLINWKEQPEKKIVQAMCDRLFHRGPDDGDVVALPHAVLGHRRLSIIDLSTKARQPMVSNDQRYYLVYNGEVYNFQELKKELEKAGHTFRTHSDTEVVLNAYIQWGPKGLDRFNGMFALAVWDNEREELFLARDRFGKKPLYFYHAENKIAFASELTALICDTSIPRTPSYEALNCYLALGYILAPLTFYKDVQKLEPAHYLLITDKGTKVRRERYWDYAAQFRTKTLEDGETIARHLLEHLERAVKMRTVSDVPLGAFLSGGIDSSSIVALLKKHHQGDLHTFSMGFDQASYNELPDADRAVHFLGTIHHNKVCRVDNGLAIMNEAIAAYDEPFADSSLIPTIELSKLTRQQVTVALSGDGADELFAGYITYIADKYHLLYNHYTPALFKKAMAFLVPRILKPSTKKINWRYKAKQFFQGAVHTPAQAHYSWRLMFTPEERVEILGEKYRDLVYGTDPYLQFARYYERVEDLHLLDQHLYVDGMTWLTDDILVKVDRASMHSSLEVRCPYLDVDLASYAAAIPAELKMKGTVTKYILKKALKPVLPPFVLTKKKSGFNAPVGAWVGYAGNDEYKAFNKYVFDIKMNYHDTK